MRGHAVNSGIPSIFIRLHKPKIPGTVVNSAHLAFSGLPLHVGVVVVVVVDTVVVVVVVVVVVEVTVRLVVDVVGVHSSKKRSVVL